MKTDPFENVYDEQDPVNQSNGGSNFVQKVDMTRGVNGVNQMGLSGGGAENERHGRGFEGNGSFTRENVCVGISHLYARIPSYIGGRTGEGDLTNLGVGIPSHFVSLKDEHIQQSRLSMM